MVELISWFRATLGAYWGRKRQGNSREALGDQNWGVVKWSEKDGDPFTSISRELGIPPS